MHEVSVSGLYFRVYEAGNRFVVELLDKGSYRDLLSETTFGLGAQARRVVLGMAVGYIRDLAPKRSGKLALSIMMDAGIRITGEGYGYRVNQRTMFIDRGLTTSVVYSIGYVKQLEEVRQNMHNILLTRFK